VRGRPDDTLVMRVRAARPDFWRGQTFDTWDGRRWTQSDQRVAVTGGGSPLQVGGPRRFAEDGMPAGGAELVQTVYVERPGPNLIFAAYAPQRLYFRDNGVFEMSDGTLRAGVQLERGAVYTVVSRRDEVTEETLRASDDSYLDDSPRISRRYGVGATTAVTTRVAGLAARITADAPTRYDKVRAIEAWMAQNTRYTLDIPPLPAGVDAVEQFLFVDRKGFCEQIATSLVVMLRALGIPARVAVGYTPGSRNPFTGLWEVRASDAHAWAEVWFPGVGWQSFDPTASVPLAGDPFSSSAATGIVSYVRALIPAVPRPVVRAALVTLLTAAASFGVARLARRRRVRSEQPWADVMLERLERAGAHRGRSRRSWESPASYADTLARSVLPDGRVREVAAVIERDAFSPAPVPDEVRRASARLLDDIEAAHPAGR
jgi:transglutaminase-like putative cysteine protease